MNFKRFPWRIFWLSLIAQVLVFHLFYKTYCHFYDQYWDMGIVSISIGASLLSTFIFICPVYFLVNSLKDQKAELHREREENQAFLASIREAVVTCSLDKKILFFNARFASLFVGTSQNERKKSFENVFAQKELLSAVNDVIDHGVTRNLMLSLPTLLDSQNRFFNINVTPVKKMKNKELYEVVCVFHDITDIKKAEQIRIEFVGNASHELRTPLTSIKGYVETLREDIQQKKYDQTEKFISVVSRNVDRLIDLVNDLLNISKMEGASELKIQSISPLLISQNVIAELMLLAQEKNISIKLQSQVSELIADSQKVEQVLRNLISNGIKYISDGKEIQVIWEKQGRDVVLKVIDNGPGISEEHHSRLFERFYRIDRGRARETGGTGLGLAIVKHIMQSHGGSIEIKSSIGIGAEFICRFPQVENPHS